MTLFNPIMWLAPFYFMGKSFSVGGTMAGFQKYTGNSDFIGFIVVGYMISSYVNMVFWSMGFSLKDEIRSGVLESNWSAPVSRIVLMISKSLFQFCATTVEIIFTGIICHFAFGFNITPNLIQAIIFLLPGLIGMLGLGLAIGSLVLLAKEANGIIDVSSGVVSALSGSYFPVNVMTGGLFILSLCLPLTYVYDSTRALLVKQTPLFSLKIEFVIIIITMVVFMYIGSWIFMRVERRCRELGILGEH